MSGDIHIRRRGVAGRITLTRAKALNALTYDMVLAMDAALQDWAADPSVALVIIDAEGDKAFCAGGDIQAMYEHGLKGDYDYGRTFWRDEYRMNAKIAEYPKPIVALMQGFVMGGGVGVGGHAGIRVVCETSQVAMPETGIGLFPDVGGGWYLSRLGGRLGPFLALTGARLDGAECHAVGLATHYIASENLARVKAAIIDDPANIQAILDEASETPPEARILANRENIDRLFAGRTLEEILAALEADDSDWAAKELKTLRAKSPQSCKVALRQLADSLTLGSFADEMRMEYRIGSRVLVSHDFAEGVRAVIVDKTGDPQWNPATPQGVTDEQIEAIFAALPEGEEWTPLS